MVSYRWIGKHGMHLADEDAMFGRARFPADHMPEDCLWVALVGAERAPARLAAVDCGAVRAMPGVVDVCLAADLPGAGHFGVHGDDHPLLIGGAVGYAGEPLAMVTAKSPEIARRAAAAILVTLEPGLTAGNHAEKEGLRSRFSRGEVAKALDKAHRVFEREWHVGEPAIQPLADTPAVVWPDGRGGLELLARSRWVHRDAALLARVLGLPAEKVRLRCERVEGPWPAQEDLGNMLRLGLACQRVGAPVRLVPDETKVCGSRQASVHITTGVNRSGKLVACRLRCQLDGGAYLSGAQAYVDLCMAHLFGPYRLEHVEIEAGVLPSHSGAYPDPHIWHGAMLGIPMEQHLNWMARELGRDPLAWRQSFVLKPGDFDALGQKVERPHGAEGVIRAARRSKAWRHRSRRRRDASAHLCWGQGVALARQEAGSQTEPARMILELGTDGVLRLLCGRGQLGHGLQEALRRAAADRLGMDPGLLVIPPADSQDASAAGPALSASSSWRLLSAFLDGADKLEALLAVLARDMLGWGLEAVKLDAGMLRQAKREASLEQLVGAEGVRVEGRGEAPPRGRGAYALSLAKVCIDELSGRHRLLSLETWLDVGQVLSPDSLARHHALACEMALCAGQNLTHPDERCSAPDALRLHNLRTRDAEGPFGARPLGAVLLPSAAAALAAALADAHQSEPGLEGSK